MLHYEIVYKKISKEYCKQILELWNGVLPIAEQLKRMGQVVLVCKNSNDQIVGVATVYIDDLRGKPYYFYRQYIRPESRNRFFNPRDKNAVTTTIDYLKTYPADPMPCGVVLDLENPKISTKLMESFGLSPLPNTNDRVWYKNFDGSTLC